MVVSFYTQTGDTSRQYSLTYFLARYSMEGEFLGMAELGNQLSMCSMTYTDTQKMKQFGVVTINTCNFELEALFLGDSE